MAMCFNVIGSLIESFSVKGGRGKLYRKHQLHCNNNNVNLSNNIFEFECILEENKTISDGGITVDFSIIKVHTYN